MQHVKEKFEKAPPDDPVALACVVLKCCDAGHLLELLREVLANLVERGPASPIILPAAPQEMKPEDSWLSHAAAAEYLGISKSTLYKYACQQKIECRKLGGRLDYRRSTLDRFKQEQVRPARRYQSRSIIASAQSSGK
jgi:excisionase family DNA binding protein